jgi:4-hydroxyphenylpyruvate dioxygenase
VPDVDRCVAHARAQGATSVEEPHDVTDEHGTVRLAAIAPYGDTRHTLVDRSRYTGPYLPGLRRRPPVRASGRRRERLFQARRPRRRQRRARPDGRVGRLLQPVMGFTNMAEFVGEDIATDYSALMSKVVGQRQPPGEVPAQRAGARSKKSPDRRVPRVLRRPGASTWRLATNDILAPSTPARPRRGVPGHPGLLLRGPGLRARIGEVRVPIEELQARGILVDRDEDGYLLQIFTKPLGDRPTVFFEFIERHGSLGFGKGNFKALFEAIEREQARRGNF